MIDLHLILPLLMSDLCANPIILRHLRHQSIRYLPVFQECHAIHSLFNDLFA